MAITFPRDLPTGIKFESSRFGLNVNQSVFSSDIARQKQVQQHAGGLTDRWEGVFTTPRLSPDQLAELSAWLVSLRGQEGTFLTGDPDLKSPRSGMDGNLLPEDSFDEFSGTAAVYRTVMGSTPLFLLGLEPGDVISGSGSVKSTAGLDQVKIIISARDLDDAFISQADGNLITSSSYQTSSANAFTIPANTAFLRFLAFNVDTTETAFVQSARMNRGSVANAFIVNVNGASQTGRALNIDGLTPDTKRIWLIGDYFTVQGIAGLYRLTENVNSDGSGQATLAFEPALRASPGDNAQVLFENTTTKCRLVTNVSAWETDHLKTGPVSFAWEEVI